MSRIWTTVTVIIAVGLTLALFWAPLPGMWWHVVRGIYYLPILLVSLKHGPIAGLSAGVAASLLYAFAADSRGMTDMAWISLLIPDFAIVGLLGGRFLKAWPRFRQMSFASGEDTWRRLGRPSQMEGNFDLNSLASIQSAAGLMSEDDTPPEQRQELAGIINTECEHLSANIRRLLQRGPATAQSQFCETDFGAVTDGAIREVEFILGGHGILVRKELTPDLPPVECDPDQIRNLLISLTLNTVQTLPAGSAVVLNTRRGEEGVVMDIRHASQGSFVSRVLNRLFGRRHEATGVALAAAYDIVRQHNGKIKAHLNVGKGLEFSVWLPLHRKDPHDSWPSAGGGGR